MRGNVIVDGRGGQHALDTHSPAEFSKRTANFVVGNEPIVLETPRQKALARKKTDAELSRLFLVQGERPIEIMGRMKKLNEAQVEGLLIWLRAVRSGSL